ncbi:MAG: TlyA family RNA methyltransferase [Candidatus Pacearchaeota archaeon]
MRLDVAITIKKLVDSREKAKFLIREGYVKVDGVVITKPSKDVSEKSKIVLTKDFEFVGRGGYKLDAAVKHFKIDFKDKVVADVGCSTGGFTDYALKKGARKIYSIDIGDPLCETLRKDKRVVYMPNSDARNIKSLDEKIDICLIDVNFLPLKEILLVVKNWLKNNGEVLGLIKPPFELLGKPKKIHNYKKCFEIAKNVSNWASKNGYEVKGLIASKLKGKSSKQQEFFIYLIKK